MATAARFFTDHSGGKLRSCLAGLFVCAFFLALLAPTARAQAQALINSLKSDVFEAEQKLKKLIHVESGYRNCQDIVNYYWKKERSYTEITKKQIDACEYEVVTKKITHNEGYLEYLRCEMWYSRYFRDLYTCVTHVNGSHTYIGPLFQGEVPAGES